MAASLVAKVLDLQRRQMMSLVEMRGARKLRRLLEESRSEVEAKLRRLMRTNMGSSFSAQHMRMVLLQLISGLKELEPKMSGQMQKGGQMAGTVSQRHLIQATKAFEKRYTGLTPVLQVEQAGVLRGVMSRVEPSLLDRYRRSTRLYTAPVVDKVKTSLAKSILQNESVGEAVERVASAGGILSEQNWRAERIVRTEMAYTYGVVKQGTMDEMRRTDLPDLQKKLIATFDSRTGEDSKELHGQTVPVDQPFIWTKPDGSVLRYMQPPNRPNDREIVIPWRPGWKESRMTSPR